MNFRLFSLFFLVHISVLFAQFDKYNFRTINISEGLSNNTVSSIAQDKFGQLWFGTSNGLNKYNGQEFKVYRNISRDRYSISNSEIYDVLVDKQGNVWAGTFNGLNKFNPKTNTFRRYYRRATNKFSLSNSLILCSLEMPNGSIWFGTGNGVSIYDHKKDRFKRFLQGDFKKGIISIHDIYRDNEHRIWLATSNGIVKVDRDENKKFVIKKYTIDTKNIDFTVNSILEVSPGIIGVGTRYNGYFYFDIKTEKFTRSKEIDIPNLDVRDLELDNDKNLWLATTSGIFIITPEKETIHIKENNVENYGTIQNFIKSIYKDKNGFIWLGTQNGGIITWDKSYQNFLHFSNNNLSNNITNSIVSDKKGNIYFATEEGVINIINKKGNVSEIFKIQSSEKNIKYPIKSLFFNTPDNLLFIGTQNKGVIVFDVESKEIRKDLITKELQSLLENSIVLDIKKDSKNNLLIGTLGQGLLRYSCETKKLRIFARNRIATNIVKSIFIDENDEILIGGTGGASTIKINEKGVADIKNYFKDKPLTTYKVNAVLKDSNGVIWAGTKTRGLYSIEEGRTKSITFVTRNKFSTVNSILEGEKGVLWLSTDKGIIKYNSNTNKSSSYNDNFTRVNNNFTENSALKIENQFYFGDLYGVTTFNQKKIIRTKDVPQVVLSELKIKNEVVEIEGNDGVLSKSLNYTDKLELDYSNSNFSITYALPNYINSKKNKYAYRLKGLDDSWTFTKQTEAFFTLQDAGEYTFQVRAANHDNIWGRRITNLTIVVHPAPWKTWWAYTIYFLFAFGILYGITWMLQSKSRLKNRLELESLEKTRNIELNKTKLQFFTNISHEFKTPLTLILGPIQNILENYSGSNTTYKQLKVVESNANRLLRLINRLMDFRKLESNQLKLSAAEGNIVKFLQEIFLSFTEHAKNGKYNYEFYSTDDEILVYYDRYKLERVFYNLISNAFKYTNKGEDISVNIYKEEHNLVVEVKDSGDGIPEEYLDKIFDRFFEIPITNDTEEEYRKGTGIGLSIASNIVKLHHGEIFANNLKPNGSIFTVKLKLGKAHLSENEILENFKMSDDVSQYVSQINVKDLKLPSAPEDLLLENKKYTILVVEDNAVLRSFIKEILRTNYNVIQAENGKVAFEKALKYLPDLIISDVIMPKMVGTELCSKIKTTLATSHIPVILLTSRSSLIYKFEGLESGADDYISKPFNLKEFSLKIHNLLESKQRLKDKFASNENFSSVDVSLTSLDEQLLKKAFKIVKDNISNQDFNVAHFSEELGVSRSMLFTKIKAWTNSTPNDFIQEVRLNRAAKLLELNKLNISEVSYEVGFKRPKYFSQCFLKKYGMTPSEFLKKIKSVD
ncbi:hybrid sensor histidine kinase/response regulator transcription factor [Hyunsoonleella pacifica]|uniref:histidine kinase n=1 Tax=Hyunsoonleella pacifica TaxID=1080224 RepID=A0A4Q9FTY2_9FLAO|nr:two-component regulator propeller domain-containing protein [Hyunsoonleella pacifica]TBN18779.1 hybrid sensor histidine kinase/response regulator [Hyunsoonleella pacifica]GGD04655.1 hybrid sensor histidine kinase/response regulator [Hyunsoonleella pacifica]